MYKIYLTDSEGTHELPPLEVPLTRVKIEKQTVNEPLSGNVYRQFIATKRNYTHTWKYLSEEEYDLLDEIYERMKEEFTYPQLTVDGENVSLMTVDYELSPKNIIDECGNVQDVTISLRETRQLGS